MAQTTAEVLFNNLLCIMAFRRISIVKKGLTLNQKLSENYTEILNHTMSSNGKWDGWTIQ